MLKQPSSPLRFSKTIVITILLSAFIHLLTFALAKTTLSQWRWQHVPFHSTVEVIGGVIALLVCFLLINLEQSRRGTSFNLVIAAAIGAMGIFDIAHALVKPGNLFVWLHSLATFFGGLLFALVLLKPKFTKAISTRFVFMILLLSLIISAVSIIFAQQVPIMVQQQRFTSLATFMNMFGGIALLLAAIKLFFFYKQFKKSDDLLFILHCSMFGFAAIMFQQSFLWDISWWGWHLLRLLAYGVALWFALQNERYLFRQLQSSNETLLQQEKATQASLDSANKRIAISERQQAAVLASLSDAIIVINQKGHIKLFSTSAESMFGWQSREVLGKNVTLLMNNEFAEKHDEFVANYRVKHSPSAIGKNRDLIAKRKNGDEFPIGLTISHLLLDEEHHFVGVIRDITERKEQERLIKHAKEVAESANNAKSAFLANTSHEIRTPMNGVYGNLQLLNELKLNKVASSYVKDALDSTKALMTVVNDILDFSKIEAGKLSLECTPFKLSELLANLHADLIQTALAKNIAFNILNQVEHDLWIGDPTRIKQVLLNICSNAIKFTQQGSVTLSILPNTNKPLITFLVNDTGIGMSEKSIDKLYLRFEQADDSITRKYGGTGLGMPIAQSLIKLMSGSINVTSELNKGTNFTIRIPLTRAKEDAQNQNAQAEEIINLSEKRLLLVEDNPINQVLVKAMLQPTKAQLTIVNNGLQALEAISDSFDLILMDMQMPVMDGKTATTKIRENDTSTPIIALTANIMQSDIQSYHEIGCNDWIGKPIEKTLLLDKLQQYLK
ncbi:Autoinducer 2 sensor kinase/phosphatase LuxQ [Pseudoalteromonas sp. P1-9]|uniref:ATP-binding protein n=1 Tax=Pseudoalteromonas sp. P1-9 TaxID=1710354 RepID=UPI0006D646E4|nr:ATP-binding protein [Pseudoalteromonas sp. P1-9]KPV97763.1 Autoinducer 2 sensor kinase/phosphatase LuxQ [Pseudoalteromonas sp. P1-9]